MINWWLLLFCSLLSRLCAASWLLGDNDNAFIDWTQRSGLDGDSTSHLQVRQINQSTILQDTTISRLQIWPNTSDFFHFPSANAISDVDGQFTLHITVNTCTQTARNASHNSTLPSNATSPALSLYVSTDQSNKFPATGSKGSQINTDVEYGYANISVTTNQDVYIGVSAPVISADWFGQWTYELGVSSEYTLQNFTTVQNIFLIDSDVGAALLTTGNLTLNGTESPPPYQFYVNDQANGLDVASLKRSYCAMGSYSSSFTNGNADTSITTRGAGGLPKLQYYLAGLNASTTYSLYLALPNNISTSVGGGTIWEPVNFTTKQSTNCQILYNLSFCTDVAYAVPTNPERLNLGQTAQFYDGLAANYYQNFTNTLQQYQCNATAESIFSRMRTCDDCADAYKHWLCAVTIPRCADATNNATYLAYRPINSSRQALVDQIIQPGPYKEVLPCIDLCNEIVQSCPIGFSFQCPVQGTLGFQTSYGLPWDLQGAVKLTCNSPEQVYIVSKAPPRLRATLVLYLMYVLVTLCI